MQTDATLLDITCSVRLHTLLHVVARCCAEPGTGQTFSYVQTDATSPNIVAPTMLGIAASVLAVLCKRLRQLLTTRNSMQQGVQTDAVRNI